MSRKIAPVLTAFMREDAASTFREFPGANEVMRAELRALLSVARAANAWANVAQSETRFMQVESKLVRALSRLDRASGGGK